MSHNFISTKNYKPNPGNKYQPSIKYKSNIYKKYLKEPKSAPMNISFINRRSIYYDWICIAGINISGCIIYIMIIILFPNFHRTFRFLWKIRIIWPSMNFCGTGVQRLPRFFGGTKSFVSTSERRWAPTAQLYDITKFTVKIDGKYNSAKTP